MDDKPVKGRSIGGGTKTPEPTQENSMGFLSGIVSTIKRSTSDHLKVTDSMNQMTKSLTRIFGRQSRDKSFMNIERVSRTLRDSNRALKRHTDFASKRFKILDRDVKRIYDNKKPLEDMTKNFQNAVKKMSQSAGGSNILQALSTAGVGDISSKLDSQAVSVLEISNSIKRTTGLSPQEMEQLRIDTIAMTKRMNQDIGKSIFDYKDILGAMDEVGNSGVRDPEQLKMITEYVALLNKVSDAEAGASTWVVRNFMNRGMGSDDIMDFVDQFTGVVAGREVDHNTIMKSVTAYKDLVENVSAGDTNKMKALNKEILVASTLLEDSFLSAEKFNEMFVEAVLNQDPKSIQKLSAQLSQVGLSYEDAVRSFERGDLSEFTADYVQSVGELFKRSGGVQRRALAETFGIDTEEINRFIEYSDQAHDTVRELRVQAIQTGAAIDKAGGTYISWLDRYQNRLSTLTVFGKDLGSIVEGVGANPIQIVGYIAVIKEIFKGVGSLMTSFGVFKGSVMKTGLSVKGLATAAMAATKSLTGASVAGGVPGVGPATTVAKGASGAKGLQQAATTFIAGKGAAGAALSNSAAAAGASSKLIRGALPVALAMSAIDVATSENKKEAVVKNAGSMSGGIAGAKAGALAGAALGSVVPVVGNAVGALVGGAVGGALGAWGGNKLGKKVSDMLGFDKKDARDIQLEMMDELDVPHYKVGTPYVPEDQLAVVHKGEAIIPAEHNDVNLRNRAHTNNIAKAEALAHQSRRLAKESERLRKDSESTVTLGQEEVVKAIETLTRLMSMWYSEEQSDKMRAQRTDPLLEQRARVGLWGV